MAVPSRLRLTPEAVQGAHDLLEVLLRDVQVNDGGSHIRVSQQQLDGSEIGTGFQQVCGKAVPQGVIMMLTILFPLESAIAITRATEQRSNWFDI